LTFFQENTRIFSRKFENFQTEENFGFCTLKDYLKQNFSSTSYLAVTISKYIWIGIMLQNLAIHRLLVWTLAFWRVICSEKSTIGRFSAQWIVVSIISILDRCELLGIEMQW
jgi:hypothetical protein